MRPMPENVYAYIYQFSSRPQGVVVLLTLALLPLAPIPLELQRRILDDAIATGDVDLLVRLCIFYLAALGLAALLKLAMKIQREFISASIVHALRRSLYYCIYTVVPPSKWQSENDDRVDEGLVVSMLTGEAEKLGGFAGQALSGPLLQAGTLVTILGYMFWIEPLVAAIALALYSPQFLIVPISQVRLNRLTRAKALKIRELGRFIVDNAENALLGREPPETYVSLTDRILNLRRRFVLTKNMVKSLNNFLIALGPFGVIAYGGWMVIQGETEIGVILAFVSGMERLGGPIRELIGSYRQIADARMRYRMLLDATPAHEALAAG
jgi:ABC-type bacteriocin/lantibiotic exporter with double-glycine peptidase domain